MRNSITPTLLQTSSLLNTVVTLFRSPSIPLQTTEWTPQLGWHDRNWNGQPSRSSAGLRGELHRSSTDPTKHTSRHSTQLCRHPSASSLFVVFKNIKFGRCRCLKRTNSSTDLVLGPNICASCVCIVV
ncbi:hypothetical protein BLNAU_4933 [Blattamonas nauphoetae]|uniref:Secreted protein n=1 Tax=Blattamonas nauphoetae TaxID=2049346 RepID=A0ABQ9Y8L1_9EUKA|nr:hypothetical protein BLNAU_4933 [Blattamonas nauphoetae]